MVQLAGSRAHFPPSVRCARSETGLAPMLLIVQQMLFLLKATEKSCNKNPVNVPSTNWEGPLIYALAFGLDFLMHVSCGTG